MKIGDKVLIKVARNKNGKIIFGGEEGIVTNVTIHNPENPIEEHGFIEVKITKLSGRKTYLQIGDLEHYSEYNWKNSMSIIDNSGNI